MRLFLLAAMLLLISGTARADCSNPSRLAGQLLYSSADHIMQLCDGTNWIPAREKTISGGKAAQNKPAQAGAFRERRPCPDVWKSPEEADCHARVVYGLPAPVDAP